jgi:hypothetical protein
LIALVYNKLRKKLQGEIRYIVDLLFGEDTIVRTYQPEQWHGELQEFIDKH